MPERPGGALAKRPLQFIYVVDCSGSMAGKKIETVNFAVRETIPAMQTIADDNPTAEVLVRVIKFSDGAQWAVSQPTEVHAFKWIDLNAGGVTDMGAAFKLLSEALDIKNMPQRGLPPVLVLMTDGQPTDDFKSGLKGLMDQPWGSRAVRVGIAIGDDADLSVLQEFIGNSEVKPLTAANVQDLVLKIKWASTVPLKAASSPASRLTTDSKNGASNVAIPAPPPALQAVSTADVF